MARQRGHIFITGTIHDITYYKMDGIFYARMKSSLSRKKVLESPSFALTRMHAKQLAEASRITSQLYKNISKEKRNMQLFRKIVGKAKVLLAEGKEKEIVLELLMNELFPQKKKVQVKCVKKRKQGERVYNSKSGKLIWKFNLSNPLIRSLLPPSSNEELRKNAQYSSEKNVIDET